MTKNFSQQNLKLFEKFGCAEVAALIRSLPEPPITLVGSLEGHDLNINLGQGHFYQGGATTFSQAQVKSYLEKPNRFCINLPALDSVFVSREANVYTDLIKEFGPIAEDRVSTPLFNDAGYLVSFGLGLGLHLPELIEKLDVRELVVAEQFKEMLQLSLSVLDWQPIFETLHKRGGRVHVEIDTDPAMLANKIFKALRGKNFGLIDGSYGIQHYASPMLNQTHDLFREMLPSLGMSDGFFDDECLMFKNSINNLTNIQHTIFQDNPESFKDKSAFIIGSGPSLDGTIEAIRSNKDNALIISSGTGLGVLLRAGIKPHVHCETENQPIVYDAVKNHRSISDFSGITLIASPTVDPRIPAEFDNVIFAHRDTLTSSTLFADQEDILTFSGPTVANFSSRIALGLGVSEIYFFGVDLGAVTPSKHHSSQSVYKTADDAFWNSGLGMLDLNIEVEGNFRPSVWSNALFIYVRSFFHSMIINNPQCQFFNCSDGAKISGTTALPSHKANPLGSEKPIVDVFNTFCSQLNKANNPSIETNEICTNYLNEQNRWFQNVIDILQNTDDLDNFGTLYDQLSPWLDTSEENLSPKEKLATHRCNSGTLLLIIQFAYFYHRRINASQTTQFIKSFKLAVLQEIQKMHREIQGLIENQLAK
ncbi:MAG: DUF115 domain-containing protein [Rhodospirillales bacterium]|nr:DUF115 domain-containing protein [Rhodospirillales bacterium]